MRSRLVSLVLLIPASWLLYSTILLLFLFMLLDVKGWVGFLVYLPLALLFVYLVVLPKVLLLDRVLALLYSARKFVRNRDYDSANQCFEQAVLLQGQASRLGLSFVLREYAVFLKNVDEMAADDLFRQARLIQLDALHGRYVDEIDNRSDTF